MMMVSHIRSSYAVRFSSANFILRTHYCSQCHDVVDACHQSSYTEEIIEEVSRSHSPVQCAYEIPRQQDDANNHYVFTTMSQFMKFSASDTDNDNEEENEVEYSYSWDGETYNECS